jgi:hypothetical protein
MQSVTMPSRTVRPREIDTGVSEERIEFDRPARQVLCAIERDLIVEQVGVIGAPRSQLEGERGVPPRLPSSVASRNRSLPPGPGAIPPEPVSRASRLRPPVRDPRRRGALDSYASDQFAHIRP